MTYYYNDKNKGGFIKLFVGTFKFLSNTENILKNQGSSQRIQNNDSILFLKKKC